MGRVCHGESAIESFAKPITKAGLLRVLLYDLNPITPPCKHLQMRVLPGCELFSYHVFYIRLLQFDL
jgi:hypothetical protein